MAAYDIVALSAFSDNYIWTLRDATHAGVVDPGEAQPVHCGSAAEAGSMTRIDDRWKANHSAGCSSLSGGMWSGM